jgi:beta-lactam-binding protein with PASTA domain
MKGERMGVCRVLILVGCVSFLPAGSRTWGQSLSGEQISTPDKVRVPKLRQLPAREAVSRVKEMSLRIPDGVNLLPDDLVVDSKPEELTWVAPGDVIQLIIKRRAPKVEGLELDAAKALLASRELTFKLSGHGEAVAKARIKKQTPSPGELVSPHDAITLLLDVAAPQNRVQVPAVTNLLFEEARRVMERDGFQFTAYAAQPSRVRAASETRAALLPEELVKPGDYQRFGHWKVYRQEPSAGTPLTVKAAMKCYLALPTEPKAPADLVDVPDLRGSTLEQASLKAPKLKIYAGSAPPRVIHTRQSSAPKQPVIERQLVGATKATRKQVPAGSGIEVQLVRYVVDEAPAAPVPDVTHRLLGEAKQEVERRGFQFLAYAAQPSRSGAKSNVRAVSLPDEPVRPDEYQRFGQWRVHHQVPPGGTRLSPKAPVKCYLEPPTEPKPDRVEAASTQPAKVAVPSVVGKQASLAEQMLRDKHLQFRVVNNPAAGPVERCDPGAGQMVDAGRVVVLTFPVTHANAVTPPAHHDPVRPTPVANANPVRPSPTQNEQTHPAPVVHPDPVRPQPTAEIPKQTPPPSPPRVPVPALLGMTLEEAGRRAEAVGLTVQQQGPSVPVKPTNDRQTAGKTLITFQSYKEQAMVPKGTTIQVQLTRFIPEKTR